MVKLNKAFFFPNGSVPVVSQFISWLNLDLGIEVCLFDGLDGYWNTWLQFVFPAYLFLLTAVVPGCVALMVPALATLFLMSYDAQQSMLWSVDGNIEYGSLNLSLYIHSCQS